MVVLTYTHKHQGLHKCTKVCPGKLMEEIDRLRLEVENLRYKNNELGDEVDFLKGLPY
jgi:hypothetical protein